LSVVVTAASIFGSIAADHSGAECANFESAAMHNTARAKRHVGRVVDRSIFNLAIRNFFAIVCI
jgi:hypothetical protein